MQNTVRSFSEYQMRAVKVPAALRNNRDRIDLPVMGLQEDSGKIGLLLAKALSTGKLSMTSEQAHEVKDRMADVLWYLALLCDEMGLSMEDVANHGIALLQERFGELDSGPQ